MRLIRTRLQSFPEFCFAFGEGYALVGALWPLASRMGMQPIGFHEPTVLLTAVHFHYAGLMAAVLAGLVASSKRAPLLLRIALFCPVLGPALLGLAFLAGPKLKLAAVLLMARDHGVLNSVGFGLCSLVGWTLLRKRLLPV